jgi:60 kDa SS-A/Ro ribonucleoprotein
MLTGLSMTTDAWKSVAHNATWQTTRMNLNTFARHGVLEDADMVRLIAERLESEPLIERARALPYQLMAAHAASARDVPDRIRQSLERAMEVSVRNVPRLPGKTWVFVDVSGSMQSPVTGHRAGATTAVRCVDVAALMAAAVLRRNPDAEVIAFHDRVVEARLNPRDSVMTNARLLASLPSGGTNCSAPMAELNRRKEHADTVIYVSDNESWIDGRHGQGRATGTMQEWTRLQGRCPRAKLVCIDIQPNSTTQAVDREDILNVGGFSDAVFGVVSRFASNPVGAQHWVSVINEVSI